MTPTEKSYPNDKLRKDLEALGMPGEKHDMESLRGVLGRFVRLNDFVLNEPDIVAEVLLYLVRKKLIDLRE
ncbi:MAG TPA: hypothetical protein VL688_05900 [Verrucomicrobiae bacterium]|nr:hypothetical protein [Verrucomicrobiae bacterium]